MQFAKKLLKLVAVSIPLLLVATAARAQNLEVQFAMPGSLTPITMLDISAMAADASGNRVFDLDVIAKTDTAAQTTNYSPQFFVNTADLEITMYKEIISGITAGPTEVARVAVDGADTLGGIEYAQSYSAGFVATGGFPGLVENEWLKLMALEFTYKKAGGLAHAHIAAQAGASAATWNGATVVGAGSDGSTTPDLTVNGPPVPQNANLTLAFGTDGAGAGLPADHKASAERATQDQGAAGTSIEVTCNLTDNDGAAYNVPAAVSGGATCSVVGTAATLAGAAASHNASPSADTEYSGDDVTTAMEINIPAGSSSGTATFEITTNSNTATLQFDFRISAVEDYTDTSGSEDLESDQFNKASVTFRIVDAALQLVSRNASGVCDGTGTPTTSESIEEGGDAVDLCVVAVSDPGGTGIAYACTLPDADASGITITGGTGTLTDGTSRTNGMPISFSLPDDNFAGGGGSTSTVTCAVTDTGGSASYSTSTMTTLGLAVTDPDTVTGGALAATATVSEKAGPAPIVVTASITGAISPGGDCTVEVTVETTAGSNLPAGTVLAAGGGTDYVGALTIPNITIAGRSRSGSSTPGETASAGTPVATSGAGVLVPFSDTDSDREAIRFTGESASCGGATNLDFGEAFTLIVDKTGGDSLKNLNYSVLPVATQFGLASAMNNIQTRATASRSGSDRQAVFSLAGNTTGQDVLMTHMKGAAALDDANDYEYDWKKAFSNSSFSMPIFGAGGGTLWASGDYRTMNGDSGVVDWEGNSFLFNFGADARLNNDMLVGLMISMSDTDIDYTDTALDTTNKGEYTITNLALRPYFAWSVGRTDIWGSIGTGSGEVEVVQEGETMARVGDTSESSLSLGVKHALVEGLSVQADISTNSTTVDEKNGGSSADGGVDSQDIDSQRARVLLVGENSYNSANGTITPKVEIGFRFDSSETNNAFGKGESTASSQEDNSTGTEAAMGVDVASGGRVMGLKARFYSGNDYDEWGISGIYEHHVGAGGLGLAMAMRPQYGNTASTTKSLFQQEFDNASNVKKTTVADAVNAPSMNSDISYGFAAPGDRGVITPYAKAVLGSNVATSSRLGMRWKPHSRFNVDVYGDNKAAADDYAMLLNWASKGPLDFALEGKRTEKAAGDISHSVVLKGTLDF